MIEKLEILTNNMELTIRLSSFLGIFLIMSIWEVIAPKRNLTQSKGTRWFNNLSIIIINSFIMRLLVPVLPVGLAIVAAKSQWGLFNIINMPEWIKIILSVIILDLIIYIQHVLFHSFPPFWRLHLVHHADLDLDVTSGLRFHPIEILLSFIIKIITISALGPPVMAVIIFETLLNGTAMFNHSNINLPKKIDRILRLIVVTPDMHRVHHSVTIRETNSNFGFNLPWWDKLFSTYRDQPVAGHQKMTIGLSQYRQQNKLNIHHLLILPFIADTGYYSINKWGKEPNKIGEKK